MKLHETLVQKLLKIYEVYSGWSEEKRLVAELRKLDLTVYKQQSGNEVLVSTKELYEHTKEFNLEKQRRGE